jgi:hypothetical protein
MLKYPFFLEVYVELQAVKNSKKIADMQKNKGVFFMNVSGFVGFRQYDFNLINPVFVDGKWDEQITFPSPFRLDRRKFTGELE